MLDLEPSQMREFATAITTAANNIKSMIDPAEGSLKNSLDLIYEAWQGPAAESYKEEIVNAQSKFSSFYEKIIHIATTLNNMAAAVEANEAALNGTLN